MRVRISYLVLASLVIGAALRLGLPGVIEYKGDERWMFDMAQYVRAGGAWPAIGMPSGVSIPNPGLSVWSFIALGWIFGIQSPVDLARAVEILNVLTLVAMAIFAFKHVRGESERERWLWAVALIAVSPIAVIYHRKIWAQCILPPFCFVALVGWWYRARRAGAGLWGFFGALLGQIHMSGFFFALGFTLVSAYRTIRKRERPAWGAWFVGSTLGALGLIPWLIHLARERTQGQGFDPWEIVRFKFVGYWLIDSAGLDLSTFLGLERYLDYFRYPGFFGLPTYFAGVAQVGIVVSGLMLLWIGRRMILPLDASETSLAVRSSLVGGLLMTLSGVFIHRHYLIITFPCEWLWLAGLAGAAGVAGFTARSRGLLTAMWALQLVSAIVALQYLWLNGGAVGGDFGVSYDRQRVSERR